VRIRRKWRSLTIRILSSSSRRRVPIIRSQMALAPGAFATIDGIQALCGEDRVECSSEPTVPVAEQELHGGEAVTEIHHQIASGLRGPCPGGLRAHPDQMGPSGTVLDRDQRIDPPEKYGVHV
jgi:hypothetical protein